MEGTKARKRSSANCVCVCVCCLVQDEAQGAFPEEMSPWRCSKEQMNPLLLEAEYPVDRLTRRQPIALFAERHSKHTPSNLAAPACAENTALAAQPRSRSKR
jgi:hypothetical protein